MGRKTACSGDEWHELTRELARRLAPRFHKAYRNLPGDERMKLWKKIFKDALQTASELAIDDCNVDRIVNEVLNRIRL